MNELEWDVIKILKILPILNFQKNDKINISNIFRSVDQPSLVGYPYPIQSNQDNERPRKWTNWNEIYFGFKF